MAAYIALLRGINVGKAKRVAMGDLRRLLEDLGHGDVATVLMSGNAVFTSASSSPPALAKAIEAAIARHLEMDVRVFVRPVDAVARAVERIPMPDEAATDPSRFHLTFFDEPVDRKRLAPVLEADWSPEAFAVGDRVTYAWHPNGVTGSKLAEAVARTKGPPGTTRNLATVTKLLAKADGLS